MEKNTIKKRKAIFLTLSILITAVAISIYFVNLSELKMKNHKIFSLFKNGFTEVPFEDMDLTSNELKKINLGRLLFNDPILSRNNDVSCATCHLSNHGFADGNSLSIGAMGAGGPDTHSVGRGFGEGILSIERGLGSDGLGFGSNTHMFRNAVSTINVKFRERAGRETNFLRDGRFGDLNFQVLVPIHTREEMCGINPVPLNNKIFSKGQSIFNKPIILSRGFLVNEYTGANLDKDLNEKITVTEIPNVRLNNSQSIPNRNECLALALAKLRMSKYQDLFSEIYKTSNITDDHLADALVSFIRTHAAIDAPIDRFIRGKQNLSEKELLGLGIFFTDAGETFKMNDRSYPGAACITCHQMPFFDSTDFYSLGVRSHPLSPLSRSDSLSDFSRSSVRHRGLSRGSGHNCHQIKHNKDGGGYVPDPGRAIYSGVQQDCFKFKVPTLRNVIETYPYFHHGTERGLNFISKDDKFEDIAYKSLKSAISHHLRGPVDLKLSFSENNTSFLDTYQQLDSQIPFYAMQFNPDRKKHKHYPIKLSERELDALTYFVAYTLRTKDSTQFGLYGNDVSHPKTVPSGLKPIVNDNGTQLDFK